MGDEREKNLRNRRRRSGWRVFFLALFLLTIPLTPFQAIAFTFHDSTKDIHQLGIPVPDKATGGKDKINGDLPGDGTPSAGTPALKSSITHTDPSTLEWIMKKIAGPDFKWGHVYRGLAYGVVDGIIVVGIGVLLVQAGLAAVTVVAVGAVVSILAAVAYSVITGDNGFVWWKAVGISVIAGLGIITWSLVAAKAAILWEKIQIGFTWAFQRLAATHLGQKLTALLGTIGTFFTTRLPAMVRSLVGMLRNSFSFLWVWFRNHISQYGI